jgi:alkaline phosphatase
MIKKLRWTKAIALVLALGLGLSVSAQENYKHISKEDSVKVFPGGEQYKVKQFKANFKGKKPKNIIFMIGDGMGIAQVFGGMTANGGKLFLENFKYVGFSRTQSADNYVTDSAAGGTALSSGYKTYNGAIGVDMNKKSQPNIREYAEEQGIATGVVSTSAITHATPASFMAHQPQRKMYEEIAGDFLNTNVDVFIGGGYDHFTKRKDGRNLAKELKDKGYKVLRDMKEIAKVKDGKLAGLTAPTHNPRYEERGDMLPVATQTALNILDNDKDGFFLMVEGSQIDWGGHQNDTHFVVNEMLDFDRAIGVALEFAAKNKETLIVVTADHETGGMAVLGGKYKSGMVKGGYATGHHSGVPVPVFAFGPGAEEFMGFMENIDIPKKLKAMMKR